MNQATSRKSADASEFLVVGGGAPRPSTSLRWLAQDDGGDGR